MLRFVLLIAGLVASVTAAFPQTKADQQKRDLKIEKIEPDPTTAPPKGPVIPRSYAVIVGISHYANVPAKLQLNFPERDAQSIYSALISPEGGRFKAENVVVLTGDRKSVV